MTTGYFWEEQKGGGIEFHAQFTGHAMAVADGVDPVCAACSILPQALMTALQGAGYKVEFRISQEDPALEIRVKAEDMLEAERIQCMMATCRAGYELLAENYPKNVCVTGATKESA